MRDTATYEIADLCRIRIRGLARFALADLNEKFAHFRTDSRAPADLDVAIGSFRPDLEGTINVDHQYHVKRGYVYFREAIPGFSFHAEISGLESDRTEVRYEVLSASRLRPINSLYPDLQLHSHVLQPLVECKLGRKAAFLLHGAALAGPGGAAVLVGRGLSYKTTYCMRMAREGRSFYGDDLVLCHGGRIHPFPIHRRYFDFYLGAGADLDSESGMRGWNNLRMVRHLLGRTGFRHSLAAPARPAKLIVIDPREGVAAPMAAPMPLGTALEKAIINMRMERHPHDPAKYVFGNFLNAYGLVFPDHAFRNHWEECRAALTGLFAGVPATLLETDTEWRTENLPAMRALLAAP